MYPQLAPHATAVADMTELFATGLVTRIKSPKVGKWSSLTGLGNMKEKSVKARRIVLEILVVVTVD